MNKWDKPSNAHDRLHQHLRNDGAHREFARSSPKDSHAEPSSTETHFAADVKRTSMMPQSEHPDAHPTMKPECILFATHGTSGVLDLGASKTVIGSNHVAELLSGLHDVLRKQVTRVKCQVTF